MKILVAPLNWGLGHASRCVPLVRRFLDEGHEVILGGDGESLVLLRRHFPTLRYVYLAPLALRYSRRKSQVWAMLKALPALVVWAIKDHLRLKALLREEAIDRVVSDNRFGLYNKTAECIYLTHQLHIFLPRGWKWLEPIAARIHVRIYARYNKVWVPDYAEYEKSLSGELGHVKNPSPTIQYIGPLSRFEKTNEKAHYEIVAVLSGLEPQRSMLEKEILAKYQNTESSLLLVEGLMNRPQTKFKRGNITIVPYLDDRSLAEALCGAHHIIARSGYSSIMDFEALGLLDKNRRTTPCKIELIPTPGQPEQEYLAGWIEQKTLF